MLANIKEVTPEYKLNLLHLFIWFIQECNNNNKHVSSPCVEIRDTSFNHEGSAF